MKRCSKCFEVKLPSEFHRCRRTKDGLQAWCKRCLIAYVAKRQRAMFGRPEAVA